MDVLAAIFALQVEQLHDDFVGVAVVDLALQENDAIFQQQIAQRQLPLPLIIAVGGTRCRQLLLMRESFIPAAP